MGKEKEVDYLMKEMFEKGSKLLTGLLVTLMMVILFAVPVLAKSYEFQYSDSSCNNDIPYIIQSGDKLLCTEEVHDGAKVVIQINYDNPDGELIDGLDNIAHIDDSDLSNSSTIKSAGGYTEWVSESAFVSEGENDKDEKIALVMINLRAKGSGSNTEEQWVEMPEGTVGKPYSAPWIKFGDDKNIQMVSAEWCTRDNERNSGISVETGKRNAKKGLAFHL
ncbi:MAG: hypothetical protein IJL90_02310, partial [Lachnospiraceae bacterium]|nr:hypothetical protein [Lachnospiraceae bacterium]